MSGDAIQGQGAGAGAAAGGGGETIVRGQNFLVAPRYVQCPVTLGADRIPASAGTNRIYVNIY